MQREFYKDETNRHSYQYTGTFGNYVMKLTTEIDLDRYIYEYCILKLRSFTLQGCSDGWLKAYPGYRNAASLCLVACTTAKPGFTKPKTGGESWLPRNGSTARFHKARLG